MIMADVPAVVHVRKHAAVASVTSTARTASTDGAAQRVSCFEIRASLNWCTPVMALLDSGAQVNVISSDYVNGTTNKVRVRTDFSKTLTAVDGRPLFVEGVVDIPVCVAGVLLTPRCAILRVEEYGR